MTTIRLASDSAARYDPATDKTRQFPTFPGTDQPMSDNGRRLTSWKEIASHMGRDVRTVMRWEKERALPVRRGPEGRRGVVFADTDDLDAWLRGAAAEPDPSLALPSATSARAGTRRWKAAAAVVILAVGLGAWRVISRANEHPVSVVVTESAIVARNADGSEKWRHEFTGEHSASPYTRLVNPVEPLGERLGFLVGTAHEVRTDSLAVRSGELLWFDPGGAIKQSFSFDDHLTFGSNGYSAPWSLSDYRVESPDRQSRVAVSAHHYEWWPSIVTILDDRWHRTGTFVHAGWIEQMLWRPGGLLAISGFSNAKDGAIVALLDGRAMNGQGPEPPGSPFACTACGTDRPLRYVVMPRSEVNRAGDAPFNRVLMAERPFGLLIRTVELPATATVAAADALYEFTPQLELTRAAYSDRYWEAHRALELAGKIGHTRAQCPERDGPSHVEIWEPAIGWRVQPVHPS
jgi:hypothetical protein